MVKPRSAQKFKETPIDKKISRASKKEYKHNTSKKPIKS